MATKTRPTRTSRKAAQKKLIADALKQPGVAETIAVYGTARSYVPTAGPVAAAPSCYSTGGNG